MKYRILRFYRGRKSRIVKTNLTYEEAIKHKGVVYEENDPCGAGVCGV